MVLSVGAKAFFALATFLSAPTALPRVTEPTFSDSLAAAGAAGAGAGWAAGAAGAAAAGVAAAGAVGAGAVAGAAGAVEAAAGAGFCCSSFLPQAVRTSRPATVAVQRADERKESFMSGFRNGLSDSNGRGVRIVPLGRRRVQATQLKARPMKNARMRHSSLARTARIFRHGGGIGAAERIDVEAASARVARIHRQLARRATRLDVHEDPLDALLVEFGMAAE